MTEQLKIALINLIVQFGLQKAIDIFTNINTAPTIDDAIKALQETQKKTWKDYKEEAGVVTPPPPSP